jgi:hypothetical protein
VERKVSQKDELLAEQKQIEKAKENEKQLNTQKIESSSQALESGTAEDFGEEVRDHVFRHTKDDAHVAIGCHHTNKMVPDCDVSNLAHSLAIHGNAHAGLRI